MTMKNQSSLFSDIPTVFSNKKRGPLSNENITDAIIDSFNEQTQLNDQFKLRIKKMIDSIEYAYPNEGIKLKEIVDFFLDKSRKLSRDQMKKLLDSHLEVNSKDSSIQNADKASNLPELTPKHNENWMKDWMEQADHFKNNPEVMALIANNVEGFLHYADKVEGKYV